MVEPLNELGLVTHELGSALAPARNAIDLVRSGTAGDIGPDAAHLLGIAARGLERADRVLQNLRALVAPETYRTQLAAVDVPALLGRIRDEFAAEAEARRVTLAVEAGAELSVPTDPMCLEQVLVNLAGNAVKFSARGGQVTLRVASARPAMLPGRLSLLAGGFGVQPAFLAIEVSDSGIGLSEEARRRWFEPFYRAPEARAHGVPGMGLGLTVARQLAGLLHGDLRPQTPSSAGTTFVVTLPADAATWELVHALDTALADLAGRPDSEPTALVVLRRRDGFGAASPAATATALCAALGEARTAVHALGTTTWLAVAPGPVRPLLRACAALVAGAPDAAAGAPTLVHAQRVRRGAAADETVLQGLVRCRHRLPAPPLPVKESPDAAHPARR
jgi:hypothetical protein